MKPPSTGDRDFVKPAPPVGDTRFRQMRFGKGSSELEFMMSPDDKKAGAFEWIVPEDIGDIRHLSVDGNYVGLIVRNSENPSAKHQWSWRVIIADSIDRSMPLAGQADDEQAAKNAAEEAFLRARARATVGNGRLPRDPAY